MKIPRVLRRTTNKRSRHSLVQPIDIPDSEPVKSPRLPWEVLERIVSYCGDHLDTVCHFSLTCRQLRPRSQRVTFAHVDLTRSKNHGVFPFVTFLQANVGLKPLVFTIVVRPTDFSPSLIYLLPNLLTIECVSPGPSEAPVNVLHLHRTSLACFRRLGSHIRTLRLVDVSFPTSLAFVQLLSALTSVTHLVCTDVVIQSQGNQGPLDVAKRHLSERLRLRSLSIDSQSLTGGDRDTSVGEMLFDDSDFVSSMLESLRLIKIPGSDPFLHRSTWPRLTSLALQLPYDDEVMANVAGFLENFHGPVLKEVVLELGPVRSIVDITRYGLSVYAGSDEDGLQSGAYGRLEHVLVKFALPRITWIVKKALHSDRNAFWTGELGKHLPMLFRRGALLLKSSTSPAVGHDDRVTSFAVSPDGKWAASASEDSTIILWDISHGGSMTLAQQWITHGYLEVLSLAFSPDTLHLLSHGEDGKAAIWDLSHCATANIHKAAILEGASGSRVSSCAWCPDGNSLATGHWDGTVRLWNAHTFLPLRTLTRGSSTLTFTKFSPCGRWLLSGSPPTSFCVWDAARGRLFRVLESKLRADQPARRQDQPMAAAFHPGGAYVAVACGADSLEVRDVATGESKLVLERLGRVDDVAFSLDGTLLLVVLGRRVLLWDFDADEARFSLKAERSTLRRTCLSPCGRYVASASGYKRVWLWRTDDGQGGRMLEYKYAVERVAFSTDGGTLFCGLADGSVFFKRIRDTPTPHSPRKAKKTAVFSSCLP